MPKKIPLPAIRPRPRPSHPHRRPEDDRRRQPCPRCVTELADWTLTQDRWPAFAWGGDRTENVIALRLHAYVVRLRSHDGLTPPPNPLMSADTPRCRRRKVRPAVPRVIEQWEASQEYWSEGARS